MIQEPVLRRPSLVSMSCQSVFFRIEGVHFSRLIPFSGLNLAVIPPGIFIAVGLNELVLFTQDGPSRNKRSPVRTMLTQDGRRRSSLRHESLAGVFIRLACEKVFV